MDEDERRLQRQRAMALARAFDVPLWLIEPTERRPRFARLRWALRRR